MGLSKGKYSRDVTTFIPLFLEIKLTLKIFITVSLFADAIYVISHSSLFKNNHEIHHIFLPTSSGPTLPCIHSTNHPPLPPRAALNAAAAKTALAAMSDGGVIITGSAGGVGFAYAGEFMDCGYDVVICDVKDCGLCCRSKSFDGEASQWECVLHQV
jgi:hypothetical protein